MIGTPEDAALAYEGPYNLLLSTMGSTRAVYLINNVVYKIEYEGEYYNQFEYDKANTMRETLEVMGIRVPKVELYANNVLAMEYIPGKATGECVGSYATGECDCAEYECFPEIIESMLHSIGFYDTAYDNYKWHNGELWIIDLC